MKRFVSMASAAALAAVAGGPVLAQDTVQELADEWTGAYNSHDEEALGALYTEDAHLYLHGQPTFEGREAIQAFWAEDMQVDNPLTVLTVTDEIEGFDMTLVHGNYQVISRETGVPLGQGRFAHIWLLTDGEWKLDRDLWLEPVGAQ